MWNELIEILDSFKFKESETPNGLDAFGSCKNDSLALAKGDFKSLFFLSVEFSIQSLLSL